MSKMNDNGDLLTTKRRIEVIVMISMMMMVAIMNAGLSESAGQREYCGH